MRHGTGTNLRGPSTQPHIPFASLRVVRLSVGMTAVGVLLKSWKNTAGGGSFTSAAEAGIFESLDRRHKCLLHPVDIGRQFQIGTGLHLWVGRLQGREAADPTELTGRPWDFPSVRKWDTLSLRITVGLVQVIARREDYIGQNKCRPTQH